MNPSCIRLASTSSVTVTGRWILACPDNRKCSLKDKNQRRRWHINKADRCELCGDSRTLEIHHIVPLVFGGSDSDENKITVCRKCHAVLTPRHELTKRGIYNVQAYELGQIAFYAMMDINDDNPGDFIYACDCFDAWWDTMSKALGFRSGHKQDNAMGSRPLVPEKTFYAVIKSMKDKIITETEARRIMGMDKDEFRRYLEEHDNSDGDERPDVA